MRVNIPSFDLNLARSVFNGMVGVATYFDRDGRAIIELMPTPSDIEDIETGLCLLAGNNVPMCGMDHQSKEWLSNVIDIRANLY